MFPVITIELDLVIKFLAFLEQLPSTGLKPDLYVVVTLFPGTPHAGGA